MKALLIAIGLVACAAPARALDPSKALSQYQLRTWTSESGLPANYINAVVHAHDGYLWIGTEEGLARFDGFAFTVFDRRNTPAFTDHNIQALHEDAGGTLWIGTRGAGLIAYRDGEFSTLSTKDGLPSDRILAIASSADGTVWVGTNGGGIVRMRGGRIDALTTANGLADNRIVSLDVDRAGTLWGGTESGALVHVIGDRVENVSLPVMDAIVAVESARDGSVWAGTRGRGLFRVDDDVRRSATAVPGAAALRVLSLHEDPEGNLWVASNGQGLLRLRDAQMAAFTTANGFPADAVVVIAEDRDGALWLGTGGGGLAQLRDTAFTPVGRAEGLSHDIALATLQDRSGALWVGTYGGGLNRIVNGRVEPAGLAALRQASVYALLEDSRGALWVGTGESGLAQLTSSGASMHNASRGLMANAVYALAEDADGNIWAGTRTGAWRWDGRRWDAFTEQQGLGNSLVRTMLRGRDGTVWFGTNGGGLSRLRDGRLETFTSSEPLANFVRAIHEDAAGNFWVGTSGGGLNLLRGDALVALTTRHGLPDDVVYAIVDDGQGSFWMSSNRGIFRARQSDLLAAAAQPGMRVRSVMYGVGDGMRSAEGNGGFQPAATRLASGVIVFPTIRGVVMVDPRRVVTGAMPSVAIEAVSLNRQGVSTRASADVPVGAGDMVFRYTGLALADPSRVRFQYRLENFDGDWVDAGTRREAYYTNIPPGRYTFRVRASAGGDAWSEPAAFALTLQPRFYQTGLFVTTVVLAVVFVLMGAYRWRLRVLRDVQAELMRLVRERTDELEDANRKLAQMSYVDAVTSVSNRRSFEEELTMEWRRSTRTKSPLSLLMVDVDAFKAFNDALGHREDDECLRTVAAIIDEGVQRAGDTVARYGGEEFAILLPDTGSEGAFIIAERIRAAVEARNIWHPGAANGRLTVSVGVATRVAGEQGEPASLVRSADEALYRAKREGRNVVRV